MVFYVSVVKVHKYRLTFKYSCEISEDFVLPGDSLGGSWKGPSLCLTAACAITQNVYMTERRFVWFESALTLARGNEKVGDEALAARDIVTDSMFHLDKFGNYLTRASVLRISGLILALV